MQVAPKERPERGLLNYLLLTKAYISRADLAYAACLLALHILLQPRHGWKTNSPHVLEATRLCGVRGAIYARCLDDVHVAGIGIDVVG